MDIKEKFLTVKIPQETHRRLKVVASSEGMSIKSFLMDMVDKSYNKLFNWEADKDEKGIKSEKKIGTFRGVLKKYKNIELIPEEDMAWAEAAEKKYGNS
jgi:hypothetical protein